jgi:hypothetical protein
METTTSTGGERQQLNNPNFDQSRRKLIEEKGEELQVRRVDWFRGGEKEL